jgi:hypothetical protein
MMDEEPSRYRRRTGATGYGVKPLDSQNVDEIKQCEEPESISVRNRELNPEAIRCTRDGDMVEHDSESVIVMSDRRVETWIST